MSVQHPTDAGNDKPAIPRRPLREVPIERVGPVPLLEKGGEHGPAPRPFSARQVDAEGAQSRRRARAVQGAFHGGGVGLLVAFVVWAVVASLTWRSGPSATTGALAGALFGAVAGSGIGWLIGERMTALLVGVLVGVGVGCGVIGASSLLVGALLGAAIDAAVGAGLLGEEASAQARGLSDKEGVWGRDQRSGQDSWPPTGSGGLGA